MKWPILFQLLVQKNLNKDFFNLTDPIASNRNHSISICWPGRNYKAQVNVQGQESSGHIWGKQAIQPGWHMSLPTYGTERSSGASL